MKRRGFLGLLGVFAAPVIPASAAVRGFADAPIKIEGGTYTPDPNPGWGVVYRDEFIAGFEAKQTFLCDIVGKA